MFINKPKFKDLLKKKDVYKRQADTYRYIADLGILARYCSYADHYGKQPHRDENLLFLSVVPV